MASKYTPGSKAHAVAEAKALRTAGKTAKVYVRYTTYTQPGRGITVGAWYYAK